MLISTREHGRIDPQIPFLDQYNRTIAMLKYNQEVLLLDASDRFVPFGLLPPESYVDTGLIVEKGDVNFLKIPRNALKGQEILNSQVEVDIHGTLHGKTQVTATGYASLALNRKLDKYGNIEEFLHNVFGDDNSNFEITDSDSLLKPAAKDSFKTNFKFTVNEFAEMVEDEIYFKPGLFHSMDKNLFVSETREFPVEFGYRFNLQEYITYTFPREFEIVEIPQNVMIRNKYFVFYRVFESEFRYAPEAAFQIGVKFIPKYFSLDGVRGSLTSWQDFGAWYFRLIQDNLRLAPQHPIPDSLLSVKDVKERIRRLYRYLQEKTRYVQIYLGIDGWKPHRVIDIHQNKYGDCKDLSVYMIAMLAKAGIKAYPALVLTRDRGWVNPKIPANHFNHCVVTVPMEKDTLWLECTSDTSPFNDPPASIEGVNVLVVKPDGAKLVRTPLSEARENQSICIARAQLLSDRSLTMEGHVVYTGNRAINMRSFLLNTDAKKQRKIFSRRFAGKGGDVLLEKFQISGLNNPDTTLTIKFRVRIPFFARKAGTRLIIQPRIFHQINFEGEPPEKRTMPLLNLTRFVDQDSIFFKLPQNFAPKKVVIRIQLCQDLVVIWPAGNQMKMAGYGVVRLPAQHEKFPFKII